MPCFSGTKLRKDPIRTEGRIAFHRSRLRRWNFEILGLLQVSSICLGPLGTPPPPSPSWSSREHFEILAVTGRHCTSSFSWGKKSE